MLQQIFGALEAFGKLFAHSLLDHSGAGEADHRTGFGDLDVPEHGEGCGHTAGGGVGEHDDERQASILYQTGGDDGARHLHQADRAFLHAGAPRRGEDYQWHLLQDREASGGENGFAHRGTHRTGDKVELHDSDDGFFSRQWCRGPP